MSEIISIILDVIMIGLLSVGIFYAMRLGTQLNQLRNSRAEMERFVADFSTTVSRAEAGIKGLKQAARAGGDDLEKQIERGQMIRDELQFLVESADQIATRLSQTAIAAARPEASEAKPTTTAAKTAPASSPMEKTSTQPAATATSNTTKTPTGSTAERDLLKALEKLG